MNTQRIAHRESKSFQSAPVVTRATVDHWPAIAQLMRCNFGEDSFMRHTPADTHVHCAEMERMHRVVTGDSASDGTMPLIALVKGIAAGYLVFEPVGTQRQPHVASFHMWIAPEWRGRGTGSALIREMLLWCRTRTAIAKIELDVLACNIAGRALYERFGFCEEGRRKKTAVRNGEYHDLIQMALWISRTHTQA